ncbi:MAG: 30S ribosomal protein S4 [Chlamydiia bacterium]|nr:30S ribosomal protein S4 [Chlamydiia bacterium]
MSSYRGPKGRIERSLEVNLFGRKNNILLRKNKPPGMHGVRRKKSAYKIGLEEKQKCSYYYGGITRKQLINTLIKSRRNKVLKFSPSGTIGSFSGLLESRLDAIVRRLGFADTPGFARQLVSHGKILVNNKKVNIRSYTVKPSDSISLSESGQKMKRVGEARVRQGRELPSYLVLSNDFTGVMVRFPDMESIPANSAGIIDYAKALQHLKKHI